MPIIKSAKKALRQNLRKRKINLRAKNKMKRVSKNLNELTYKLKKSAEKISDNSLKEMREGLRIAYKAIDKAAQKGVIKKNTAARKKSKLAKKISSLEELKK